MSSLGGVAIGAGVSLGGVAIGAAAAYFGQVRQWKRTSRYDRYRSFAGSCEVAFGCLLDVRHALKRELPESQIDAAWQRANAELRNVRRLFGEMQAGATEKTEAAAKTLRDHLSGLRDELFNLHQSGRKPEKDDKTYALEFQRLADALTSAAETDLRLRR